MFLLHPIYKYKKYKWDIKYVKCNVNKNKIYINIWDNNLHNYICVHILWNAKIKNVLNGYNP